MAKLFHLSLGLQALVFSGLAFAQATVDRSSVPFSSVAPSCTPTNGQTSLPSPGANCNIQPELQTLTFYKVALCTSKPTAPTTSAVAGTSSCSVIFSSTTGQDVTISTLAATPLSAATKPANGTYNFLYIETSNTQRIKAKATFAGAAGDSNGTSTGATCFSRAVSSGLFNWSMNTQGAMPLATKCGSSTDSDYAATAVVYNSFDGDGFVNAITNMPMSNGSAADSINSLDAYLLNANGFLANPAAPAVNDSNEVVRLSAIMTLPSGVTVGSGTQSINLGYNNSLGAQIATQTMFNNLQNISKFGTGPLDMTVSVSP